MRKKWYQKYKALLQFYKIYTHTDVPVTKSNINLQTYILPFPNDENNPKDIDDLIALGCWTRRQRQWYRRQMKNNNYYSSSSIKTDEIDGSTSTMHVDKRMKALTLIFGEGIRYKKYESKWEHMFQQLMEFRQVSPEGNCLVPRQYPKNPKLANWVSEQRRQYPRSTLSNKRIQKLQSIGFIWTVRRGPKNIDPPSS